MEVKIEGQIEITVGEHKYILEPTKLQKTSKHEQLFAFEVNKQPIGYGVLDTNPDKDVRLGLIFSEVMLDATKGHTQVTSGKYLLDAPVIEGDKNADTTTN